ncbi:MAG: helix-turn-helix domain-containing protein [Rhizobiaceae bacterium]
MKEAQADQIIRLLEDLRRLAILGLLDSGYKQSRLAEVLGVSQPTISRMFPSASKSKSQSPRADS